MKVYTSCFIGIALPPKYQIEFENLLTDIKTIEPSIEIVCPKTPHITLYYLNKQSQYLLDEITSLIKPELSKIKSAILTVGGFDYFTDDNPQVLFVNVNNSTPLAGINAILKNILHAYGDTDNSHLFHPHLTIGRLLNKLARENFNKSNEKLRARLEEIKWNFSFNELIIYGVDSTQSPQIQEILTVLPIN